VTVHLQVPGGQPKTLRALYDSGAEISLVNRGSLSGTGITPKTSRRQPMAMFLDDKELRIHGSCQLTLDCPDSMGTSKQVGPETFWAADFSGYDLVLGYPWLAEADPCIRFAKGTFEWFTADAERIQLASVSDLFGDLQPGEQPYLLHPKSLAHNGNLPEVDRELAGQRPPDHPKRVAAVLDKHIVGPSAIPGGKDGLIDLMEDVQYASLEDDRPDEEELCFVPCKLHHKWFAFSKHRSGVLPPHRDHDHAIDIEEGAKVPNLPIYNLSRKELDILREYLDKALEKGWIRPSKSPAGAPILFVPKADGTMRLCVDYRGLNKVTIKNRYPIPLVSEMLDRLSKAKVFTKLDLRDAYHRLRIKKGDEWKTAFKTRYGHFEYLVMPFGLANAPATFQSYIHRALGGLLDRVCVVYLDDILIYSENEEDHDGHVEEVLDRLVEWGLFAKASKCTFSTKSVEFLGFIATPDGVVMDPERVRTITEWPEPSSYKDIQVFLGFANFYRRFVYNYSGIVRPLVDHMTAAQNPEPDREGPGLKKGGAKSKKTRKGPTKWYKPWSWPEVVRAAFLEIRSKFTEAPVLQHFDPIKPIIVLTDASDFAMAAILLQPQTSELATEYHWKPVAFWSKKFQGPSVRWHTHDKELSAIVEAFRQWRHYLEYAPSTIRVLSDHNNLRYFMTTKELSPKQARWAEELARFDFEVEYKPGPENAADGPSRRPDYAQGLIVGEQQALRDAMLPTLQQKLRIWAIRKPKAQNVEQATQGDGRPGVVPMLNSQSPGRVPEEFHRHEFGYGDSSPSALDQPSIDHCGRGRTDTSEARETHFDVAKALLCSLDGRIGAPTKLANEAAQDESAYALEIPERLTEFIRQVQERDKAYPANESLTRREAGGAKKGQHYWEVDPNGALRRSGKVWIPEDVTLRQTILSRNHDDPMGGHYGVEKTAQLLKRKYYWPMLTRDVHEYIRRCPACQLNKIRRHKPWGLLTSLPVPNTAWRHFSLDFVTDLPVSKDTQGNEYDSILVLVDRFSKYVRYIPVTKAITAQRLAETLLKQCFLQQGPPDTLLSDRGSVFTSQFWSDICYHLKIDHRLSTAFHPQTDGQTERQNQELETYLRIYMSYQQDNWVELLPYAEYAYNSKTHSAHGESPIKVAYGLDPKGFDGVPDEHWLRRPPEVWGKDAKIPELRRQVAGRLSRWHEMWATAKETLEYAQESNARWYNTKRSEQHFAEGDQVLLRAKNLLSTRPSKKFDARYLGPFVVTQKVGKLAYRLELPPSMDRVHPVFNVALLEPWREPLASSGFRPGPVQVPEDTLPSDRYEVEGILGHRDTVARGREYRVKWLGWSVENATWEPLENLDHCEQILEDYHNDSHDLSQAREQSQRRKAAVDLEPPRRKRGRPRKSSTER
jgi:hypothetical protein